MAKLKRQNYLIDKTFQLGFIGKYLMIILLTVVFCFGFVAFYYYQATLFGSKRLDQNVEIKTRSFTTAEGYKIFKYEKEQIDIYEKTENGVTEYYCLNPYDNETIKVGQIVNNVDINELTPGSITSIKVTNLFSIIIFPLIWTCIAVMVIIGTYTLFFSHRIAGPIYRMKISLDRMLAGDYDFKIKVRKNDFHLELVDKMEQLRLKIKNNTPDKTGEQDK